MLQYEKSGYKCILEINNLKKAINDTLQRNDTKSAIEHLLIYIVDLQQYLESKEQ